MQPNPPVNTNAKLPPNELTPRANRLAQAKDIPERDKEAPCRKPTGSAGDGAEREVRIIEGV